MDYILLIEGIIIFIFFSVVAATSLLERENRAVLISVLAGLALSLPFFIPILFLIQYPDIVSYILSLLFVLPIFLILVPIRFPVKYEKVKPDSRFDERDTMLSRKTLTSGSDRFNAYYKRNPDKRDPDEKFRSKPGLLKAGSKYYDPVLFGAALSIFNKVDDLHPRVEGEPNILQTPVDPEEISDRLTKMIVGWGAHSAGIAKLCDYHVYSVGGRGERYDVPYKKEHTFAIAFTAEMDYDMMRFAPAAPTVVESANQYLQSALIAIQIADFIRDLGYPARAHIDGNYKVICPLVARDAGLGEIGRMGLLMTPGLGPRVRIAVITTDMPLIESKDTADPTMIDFCRKCEKCATVCPGQSIPFGEEEETGPVKRWKINSESCYTYWCVAGTDCGRCMIVCPFSHPDNWFHRMVRFGIRNSYFFRSLAVPLDDLFYGKKPKPKK